MTQTLSPRTAELEVELRRHKKLYYDGTPEITDAEYDALESELESLYDFDPSARPDESVLDEVGAPVGELFDPVRHDHPMLSLNKVHNNADLDKFLASFKGKSFLATHKFDGTSASLTYKAGKLVRAATRGDGEVGEDVTKNVIGMKGVPSTLPLAVDVEVRGEVVMLKSDFNSYNAARPEAALKNPRNAAAGTLRAKDRAAVADRPLTFMAFDVIGSSELPSETAEAIKFLGFELGSFVKHTDPAAIFAFITETDEKRQSYDYDLDGVVIRLADRREYEAAGATGHHPKGAIAYKLAAEIGETTLLSVTWQVGKTGVVAPVAEIVPLFLAGTTISRATLHNLSIISERQIKEGQRIQIKRAGDVIPYVIGPVAGEESKGTEIHIPSACPSCGGALILGSSQVVICANTQGCPAQALRRLIHWASRAAADIDAIGESWIEKFYEAGILNTPSDFYKLTRETLLGFDRMGDRLADKMIASIETSKGIGLRKCLIGWSIPMCSEGTAKRLCRNGYESVEQVAGATEAQLIEVEDVGPVVAHSIVTFFSKKAIKEEITLLRSQGVSLDVRPEDKPVLLSSQEAASQPFFGKAVVITGTLTVGRKDFQTLVESKGAKASGSISAKTDYLIVGENAGSKLAKAESLGVAVLTEAQAREMMGE
jgi:DNA ligase (NAD+)